MTDPWSFVGLSWQEVGPQLFPIVAGALLAAYITWRAQRRTLRNQLSLRMAEAAYTAYRRPVEYYRWARYEADPAARAAAHQRLVEVWVADRVELDSVQRSVNLYFGPRSRASRQWHALADSLAVFYLLNAGAPTTETFKTIVALRPEAHADRPARQLADRDGLEKTLGDQITTAMSTARRARMRLILR